MLAGIGRIGNIGGMGRGGAPFVVPSGMGTPLILPERITAQGTVVCNKSIVAACYDYNASIIASGERYVSNSGSDSNPGTYAQPYLTLNHALRNTLGSTRIYLLPGTYTPNTGPRNGDTSQPVGGRLLHVSPAPGVDPSSVVIRVTGPDLSSATWTLTSGTVYETTCAASTRCRQLTRADILGADGYPLGLREYSSVATLEAGGTGFWHDTAGAKLYVALGGWNVNTNKAILKGYYDDGSNNRFYVRSAPMLFENCNFEGTWMLFENAASQPQCQLWMSGGRMDRPGADNGQSGCLRVQGDGLIVNGTRNGDNMKCFSISQGIACTGYEINVRSTNAGAVDTLGTGATMNGSSAHGTGGKIYRYGGTYAHNAGPNIGDTGSVGVTDNAWMVGCHAENSVSVGGGTSEANYAITDATSGTRNAWLDSCTSADSAYDLNAAESSTGAVNIYLNNSPLPIRTGSGATITAYERGAPG